MLPIVQDGDPALHTAADPVEAEEFGTEKLATLIQDMLSSLDGEPDGVALAAPQIGVGKRIFVVRYDRLLPPPPATEPARKVDVGVYVNPKILKTSRKRSLMDEGCLSTRGTYGTTQRFVRATVEAKDENGKVFTRGGGGILAQVFQHEIDHLDGTLFIDHATDIYEAPNEPNE